METTNRYQYNPFEWPPDLTLAHLHARCSMPGKQNQHGQECPCCLRRQRLRTTNWVKRNLYKDFKYYGGGVSGYFGMLSYYGIATLILIIMCTIYHMICIKYACTHAAIERYKCVILFSFIKIMSPDNIYIQLQDKHPTMVQGLNLVYFITFAFLLLVNFGSMTHLGRIQQKLTKSIKIFSHFSLIFRNIPRFMDLNQFKKSLVDQYPEVQIKQIFFLHKTSKYYESYHKLIETYYQMQYYKSNQNIKQLQKLQKRYLDLMKQLDIYKQKFQRNTGRAIVVFQQQSHKDYFANKFKISTIKQIFYNFGRLLKIESVNQMGQYSDSVAQPGEIIWKYIGDSSVAKSKVRLETIFISIIFLGISTAIIFFPIKKANTQLNHKDMMIWNIISGCIIFVLNLLYRFIMTVLSDKRKPNTYLSRSFYIVLTTVFFHILFYLYLPAIYYTIDRQSKTSSIKLGTLFFQVIIFAIIATIIAAIDFQYCIFSGKRRKYLADTTTSSKFCQKQLHEKLNYPSFPIQFKLMIMYKIWSFVVFYTFQIPQILFLLLPLMIFLYIGDKYRVYTRYKMSSFLPIQLEKDFDRTYIYVYLITLCLSYLTTAYQTWQFIVAPVLAVLVIALRFFLDYRQKIKQQNQQDFSKTETLANVLRTFSNNAAVYQQIFDRDSQRLSMISEMSGDSMTLKTVDGFTMGYKQVYDSFLYQLNHKKINQMFEKQFKNIKVKYQPRADSEMIKIQKS